jgi:toxin ParE1/3/4
VKIEWTAPALQHLREAREYIEIDNPAAAARQIDLIEASVNHLRAFPMMGRAGRRAGTRELPVPGTPYILVYRVKQMSVQVLAILHGARNWQE